VTREKVEALLVCIVFVGVALNGFRTGKMPGNPYDANIARKDVGFWIFGAMWLGMACVALYVGFFEATS